MMSNYYVGINKIEKEYIVSIRQVMFKNQSYLSINDQ